MGHRIAYEPPVPEPRHRRPRVEQGAHLDAIRTLPCLTCGSVPVEAAHIRSGSRKHGKRPTGTAEKPSDHWTLPLCTRCHRIGPTAQHSMNELEFYRCHGIDPFATALALWAASGSPEVMLQIVMEARRA